MGKFAPVVPVNLAFQMRTRGLLGDYHLLLAHDVVKHADAYYNVYNDQTPECNENFIIMDNSVVELGTAVSGGMLQEACEIVNADVLALPDVMLDSRETFVTSLKAFADWHEGFDFKKCKPMIIPQGRSFADWTGGVDAFSTHPISEVCCVGIPRNIKEKLAIARTAAVMYVHDLIPKAGIHLLGFSNDLKDDLGTFKMCPYLWGIDSAVPIRQGHLIRMDQSDPGPRGDWWEHMTRVGVKRLDHDDWRIIEHNLDFVRKRII